jgi:hypothetical protein
LVTLVATVPAAPNVPFEATVTVADGRGESPPTSSVPPSFTLTVGETKLPLISSVPPFTVVVPVYPLAADMTSCHRQS